MLEFKVSQDWFDSTEGNHENALSVPPALLTTSNTRVGQSSGEFCRFYGSCSLTTAHMLECQFDLAVQIECFVLDGEEGEDKKEYKSVTVYGVKGSSERDSKRQRVTE